MLQHSALIESVFSGHYPGYTAAVIMLPRTCPVCNVTSLVGTCKGSAEERTKAKCQPFLLRPSFLLSQHCSSTGQRGLWLWFPAFLLCRAGGQTEVGEGDKGMLQGPWGESPIINRWQQHPDSVITQVIPQPSCFSGLPLVTYHRFPAGRTFLGARVYSVSSKKFWSGNCSLQNLVGAHIELMSQWTGGQRRGISCYEQNNRVLLLASLPSLLLSCFTNLGEPSASLVPARTVRETARSCSVST